MALQSPSWFTATSGTWYRQTNSTKFRQFSYIVLIDTSSKSVASLPEFPYAPGSKFTGSIMDHLGPFQLPGDDFDVEIKSGPPPYRSFRIRETWGAAISYVIGQAETVTFEIYDPKTQETATYRYKGVGLSIGLPIPKIPKTLPGASAVGPWNDFQAPSWWTVRDFGGDARLHSDNLGLGTSVSSNFFEFRGHVNNYPGYEVQITSLQTGRTYSLPSSGETSGSMEISN
ncbi:MAG: hypothetical protein ABSA29_18545 [Terriglobales bacterium]